MFPFMMVIQFLNRQLHCTTLEGTVFEGSKLRGDLMVVSVVVDSTVPSTFVTIVVVVTPVDVDCDDCDVDDAFLVFDSLKLAISAFTSSVFKPIGTGAASTIFFLNGKEFAIVKTILAVLTRKGLTQR